MVGLGDSYQLSVISSQKKTPHTPHPTPHTPHPTPHNPPL
ncbi:hypothetical protein BH695_2141 [Microcystis aeruginosa PCC 7806SL]|uniref:Uncharacterized protein n=1 Tax=Microcystis aeruginosa PCC 7806SL TaxID=1903187 RepID=A0AB33BY94_MICA7|nr:hypothetical protein BH695_2141 [Microcystis aeruginosa PCC 7806SL]